MSRVVMRSAAQAVTSGPSGRGVPLPTSSLRNFRSRSRSLCQGREICGHKAGVNVDALLGTTGVPETGRRFRRMVVARLWLVKRSSAGGHLLGKTQMNVL